MPREWLRSAQRAAVNGVEFEYTVVGSGEPVVSIHGSPLPDRFFVYPP